MLSAATAASHGIRLRTADRASAQYVDCRPAGRRIGIATEFADHRVEWPAFDELHRVIVNATVAADRVDGNDVRVMQLGSGMRLGSEPPELFGVQRRRERKHL